jgi:hypothetical protein
MPASLGLTDDEPAYGAGASGDGDPHVCKSDV